LIIEEALIVMNEPKVKNQSIIIVLAGGNTRSEFNISDNKWGALQ